MENATTQIKINNHATTWEPVRHSLHLSASDVTKGLSRDKSDDDKRPRFSTFRKIFRASTLMGMHDSDSDEDDCKPNQRPNSFLSTHRLSTSTSALPSNSIRHTRSKSIHTESLSEFERKKSEKKSLTNSGSKSKTEDDKPKHEDKYFKKWMKKLYKRDIEKKAKQGFLTEDEVELLIEIATGTHFIVEPSSQEELKRLACFALAAAAFPVETVSGCRKKLIGNGLLEPFLHYAVDNIKEDNETEEDASIPVLTVHNEIKESEIEVIKQIAHGASAKIYLAKYKGREVAVKVFDKDHISFSLKEFKKELFILSVLQNDHFVRCYGGGSATKPFIVSEFMSKGPLSQFLKESYEFMDLNIMIKFAKDISSAMKWLHSIQIIHRDLKSHNVLINDKMECKIIDFGTSRVISVDKTMTGNLGTPQWIAPELFRADRYTEKADVYSFGIVMWEILTGQEPFTEISQTWKIPEQVVSGYRPQIDSSQLQPGSEWYVELMKLCWDDDPNKRPSFEELEYAFGLMLKNLKEDGTYATELSLHKLLAVETVFLY